MMARDRSFDRSSFGREPDGPFLAREICDEIGIAWMAVYAFMLVACVAAILGGSFALASALPPVTGPAACAIPVRL